MSVEEGSAIQSFASFLSNETVFVNSDLISMSQMLYCFYFLPTRIKGDRHVDQTMGLIIKSDNLVGGEQ